MQEDSIRRFFKREVPANLLGEEASRSVKHLDAIRSEIAIKDMDQDFALARDNLVDLCDSAVAGDLNAEAVTAIAFAILASDRFIWEDSVMSEVLNDWSCPEVNYPLIPSTLEMHRRWLTGEETPVERPPLPKDRRKGPLVSLRWKSAPQAGDSPD